jgi:transaldolase
MKATGKLHDIGQSLWLDNITRGLITSGTLGRYRDEFAVTGLTSNPTIFDHAMRHGTDYDAEMRQKLEEIRSPEELFLALALTDLRQAADLFRPIHARTNGVDGWVSLELSPLLAYDTAKSIAEAKRLYAEAGRPNFFIKIPGTPQGIPAFEQAIAEGININVTLLFALASYEQVAHAYIRGLERRAAAGQPIDHIASVASFFVSRVDTAVDQALEERIRGGASELRGLLGKAAIANARLAYRSFTQIFGEPRFQALAARGAMVQRPLWASTSTKNPAYRDVMYVEELIGPHTVNTMPPATIEAFRDHGLVAPTLERDVAGAEEVFRRLAAAGLDIDAITRQLQVAGVHLFAESFDKLVAASDRKRQALLTELVGQPAAR